MKYFQRLSKTEFFRKTKNEKGNVKVVRMIFLNVNSSIVDLSRKDVDNELEFKNDRWMNTEYDDSSEKEHNLENWG